jgi:hypothetical protein
MENYFAALIQNHGAKEIILVGDYTKPSTKKQQRETKPPERSDTGPPMCPKRRESCGPPMSRKRIESYAPTHFNDEITTPGGSSSRKEILEFVTPSPSKTSLNNNTWKRVLDVAPRFPPNGNQSRSKKSLKGILDEVEKVCGTARIGSPYDDMILSPKSARWSARPALVHQKSRPDLFLRR